MLMVSGLPSWLVRMIKAINAHKSLPHLLCHDVAPSCFQFCVSLVSGWAGWPSISCHMSGKAADLFIHNDFIWLSVSWSSCHAFYYTWQQVRLFLFLISWISLSVHEFIDGGDEWWTSKSTENTETVTIGLKHTFSICPFEMLVLFEKDHPN